MLTYTWGSSLRLEPPAHRSCLLPFFLFLPPAPSPSLKPLTNPTHLLPPPLLLPPLPFLAQPSRAAPRCRGCTTTTSRSRPAGRQP